MSLRRTSLDGDYIGSATGRSGTPVNIQKKFIQCEYCKDIYRDPRILNCLHSFCLKCLLKFSKVASVSCPTCRVITPLYIAGGVANLKANTFLSQLVADVSMSETKPRPGIIGFCKSCEMSGLMTATCTQCSGTLCTECEASHKKLKLLRNHCVISGVSKFAGTNWQPSQDLVNSSVNDMEKKLSTVESNLKKVEGNISKSNDARMRINRERDDARLKFDKLQGEFAKRCYQYTSKVRQQINEDADNNIQRIDTFINKIRDRKRTLEALKNKVNDISTTTGPADKRAKIEPLMNEIEELDQCVTEDAKQNIQEIQTRKMVFQPVNRDHTYQTELKRLLGFMEELPGSGEITVLSSGMSAFMESFAKETTIQIYYENCNNPRTAKNYTRIAKIIADKFKSKFCDTSWSCLASGGDAALGWSLFCNTWIMLQMEDILVFIFDDKP